MCPEPQVENKLDRIATILSTLCKDVAGVSGCALLGRDNNLLWSQGIDIGEPQVFTAVGNALLLVAEKLAENLGRCRASYGCIGLDSGSAIVVLPSRGHIVLVGHLGPEFRWSSGLPALEAAAAELDAVCSG